ncbi:oligosaccharide flippase family protein [Candidatus Parcubacteria bacterium]|nr:oligosaccharide flippase family protein [Candidatus Parcubacteria bacterium]
MTTADQLTKKITESSFLLSASSLLSRFISFGAVIIITRLLNLYEYGALVLAMTVSGPVNIFSSFGLESVIISDLARFRGEKMLGHLKKLLISYSMIKLLVTTAIVLMGWFLKPILVARFGDFIDEFFLILVIWVYAVIFYNIFTAVSNAFEDFKIISIADLSEVTVKTILVLVFWMTNVIDIKFILIAYLFGKIFNVGILFFFSIRKLYFLKNIVTSKEAVYKNMILRHGKWAVLSQTVSEQLSSTLKPWIIKFLLGVESVALFSVASSLYSALARIVPIKQVIFPIISRRIDDKDVNVIIAQKATKYSFIFYFIIGVVSFFLIVPFINIFFPQYESSIILFRLLLARMLITATGYGHMAFFYAYKEQKQLFKYSFIDVFALFTILPACILLFGLPGIYIERLITIPLLYGAREHYLRKKYNIATWRLKALFTFDFYDKYFLDKVMHKIRLIFKNLIPKKG